MQEKTDSRTKPKSLDDKIKELFPAGFDQYDRSMREKLYFNMTVYDVTRVEFVLANGEAFIAYKDGVDGEFITQRKSPEFLFEPDDTKVFLDMAEVKSKYLEKTPRIYSPEELKELKGENALKYVITQSGYFLLARDKEANHNDLARGEPVIAAGTLVVREGVVTEVSSMSGRYRVLGNDVRGIQFLLKWAGIEVLGFEGVESKLSSEESKSNAEQFLENIGILGLLVILKKSVEICNNSLHQ